MKQLHNQNVLVLGLGVSGLAMAKWCTRHGARAVVVDTRAEPPELARLGAEAPAAKFENSVFDVSLLERHGIRAVFASPGLSPASTAAVMQPAREQGLWCGGELTLFAEALTDLRELQAYAPTVLAVTGTNGKTTVTSLTGQLAAAAGRNVAVAGNIGPSLLDTLAECLDADRLPEVWVVELSSFQLALTAAFEPTAAAVLNLTQDHLDWHGSMQEYVAAKARVLGKRALAVLNRDDPAVMALLLAAAEPVKKGKAQTEARLHVTFGTDLPARAGDLGIEVVHGMSWLVRAASDPVGSSSSRRRGKPVADDMLIQRLMPADALRIRGRHNALNALAALALATAAGCSLAPMLRRLQEYRGEPHRVERVGLVDGIEYFDDSKGTNVGATVAALQGLGVERKLVAILGGDGKGQDFSPLVEPVARYVRSVILIGRDAALIRDRLASTNVPLFGADTMEAAVRLAANHAVAGDAVLMSPACASFDMYRNYEHRAEAFHAAVLELAHERGVQLEESA